MSPAEQHHGRRLLIPGEPRIASLALEQQLILAAGGPGRENERTRNAAPEAQQQARLVLERATGVVAELGEHLGDLESGHVLGEIEPVRAEVAHDVRRARASRILAPA